MSEGERGDEVTQRIYVIRLRDETECEARDLESRWRWRGGYCVE
jgi:hypothetical protein